MRLQHIPFTLAAIQLSPKAAAGMTIRTDIAESRPALIRTVRIGAEMLRGVHLARAAPGGGARRGWDRRRRGRRFLRRRLTGGTVGFTGEAGKRLRAGLPPTIFSDPSVNEGISLFFAL